MSAPSVIVIDLDGTLCNSAHREHLARAQEWDEFHSQLFLDEPWPDVAALLPIVSESFVIVGLTGRSSRYQTPTLRWLIKHKLEQYIDFLLMRPDGDWRSDNELKPALLDQWLKEQNSTHSSVLFILEDRDKMVEAWRELGHNCWQVRPGGY